MPGDIVSQGSWYAMDELSKTRAAAIGVDWCIPPKMARAQVGKAVTLQGNFDPAKLLSSPDDIEKEVKKMIDAFGVQRYIANLGHGILPNVPVENAKAFVDAVKNYTAA